MTLQSLMVSGGSPFVFFVISCAVATEIRGSETAAVLRSSLRFILVSLRGRRLEVQLEGELKQPRVPTDRSDLAEARGVREMEISRFNEIHRIREVECFRAELETSRFVHLELFEKGSVEVHESRTAGLLGTTAKKG